MEKEFSGTKQPVAEQRTVFVLSPHFSAYNFLSDPIPH